MTKKYEAILVPTTHWDREHSQPFEQFRWHLVTNVVDKLLEILATQPEFKFTFDGQALAIEDYLEIRPEREAEVRKYVQEGRLALGPFFVGPDEFMPSGESLVRNLLYGHKIARRFGRAMRVGYNPDAFGHIGQLPQILKGFGIDTAVFSRGIGEGIGKPGTEFRWAARDGSEVLAIHHFYGNAALLPADLEAATERLRRALADMQPKALPYYLLSNGTDGTPPQGHMPEVIEYANRHLEDSEVICGTLEDFVGKVRPQMEELPRYQGELRWGKYNLILGGVYSARTYLKQANAKTQMMLERLAEPFAAWAWLVEGEPYPQPFLERAWRLLLQNHFHDTICGCSQDKVYRDAMMRYAHAQQISEKLLARATKVIARNINTESGQGDEAITVVVFNPLGFSRSEVAYARMYVPFDDEPPREDYVVHDTEGRTACAQVCNAEVRDFHQPDMWERPLPRAKRLLEFDLAFGAQEVPACGYRAYTIHRGQAQPAVWRALRATGNAIENELVKVEVAANGTVKVTDKRNGAVYDGLHLFEDIESVCGEYHHYTTPKPQVITGAGMNARVALVEAGPVRATLKIEFDLLLPEGTTEDYQRRSAKMVPCPIATWVTVTHGSPRVDFLTVVENNAKDHRLRVLFPTGIRTDRVHVEAPFEVVERKIVLPEADGWVERPAPEGPQQAFVDVSGGGRGLAMINEGLAEYAAIEESDGVVLALTLLRGVGWIGREGFVTAAYAIPTPEAQCLGRQEFRYALMPHEGDWREGGVMQAAHAFNVPLQAAQTSRHAGALPRSLGFLTLEPSELVVTAIKKAEEGDAVVVRLYNPTDSEVEARLSCFKPLKAAQVANLLEEPLAEAAVTDGSAHFAVAGHKIVTLKLRLR